MTDKIRILIIFLFLIQCTSAYSQCYELVWSDEFDVNGAPNSTNWGYDIGTGGGWGNNEVQSYTNSSNNIRQENGLLIIEAKKSGNNWSSARLKSQGKKTFTYGRIVFRAKLPVGSGSWPALWMLGENITSAGWPACGEIDVMEHVGKNPGVVQSAMHTPSSNGNTQNKGSKTVPTFNTEFHNYEVLWTTEKIQFLIDGVLYYTYNPATKNASTWPFNAPQFIIMNVAMGGNFGSDPQFETGGMKNGIDPNLTTARMEVDYVRYYEPRTSPALTGPSFVSDQQENLTFQVTQYPDAIYTWTVPNDAQIITGQGTNVITVNWGSNDGDVTVAIDGETGCTNNTTVWPVKTIIQPDGPTYLVDDFANNSSDGWSDNVDNTIIFDQDNGVLTVDYNTSSLQYLQFQPSHPVNLKDHGIIKFKLKVPSASASIPNISFTLEDANGNETKDTQYNLNIASKDDQFHTYSYDFEGLWLANNPDVNPEAIRTLRFYILAGDAQFILDDLYFYNSKTVPSAPTGLSFNEGAASLNWVDNSNGIKYHIYRSDTETGEYTRFKSNVLTKDVPAVINLSQAVNYLKVTSANSQGESAKSEAIMVEATVSGINNTLDKTWSIFPNPTKSRVNLKLDSTKPFRLKIHDVRGLEQDFSLKREADLYQLEMLNTRQGIYYIVYTQAEGSSVKKLIIE